MAATHKWGSHTFGIYPLNTTWYEKGGVYIFCRGGMAGLPWTPLYIGQTSNLKSRLAWSHEKWGQALTRGMTHIHALGVEHKAIRENIETDLIRELHPPLNL